MHPEESKAELKEAIMYAVSNNEKVLIPAFAVERTQELLYVIAEFKRKGEIPNIPVYLDSPLAIKATEIFRKNRAYYDMETMALVEKGIDPLSMPNLHFTLSTKESMEINERSGPAIVIAGNGMCTGGRIRHHLKHNLWKRGVSLVIVGYQALGTTGRQIVDGARHVRIFGEKVAVGARVFTIGGFSAHADQREILDWVSRFESRPVVYIVHGEPEISTVLKGKIEEMFGLQVHIPEYRERIILKPRVLGPEVEVPKEGLKDSGAVYLNLLLDMEREIKKIRERVSMPEVAKEISEEDIDRLSYLLEEVRELLAEEDLPRQDKGLK
jgi:metallo-beta-lactamase family protein